ncbi:MAG: hypothetical protein RIT24_2058 [Planctomycetota bacterium]|jgi:hypothetical protein
MTRIAPTRSSEIRANDALVDARWRIRVRDAMALSILPGPERGAVTAILMLGSERVVIAGRAEESDLEVRFTFEAVPELADDSAAGVAQIGDARASRLSEYRPAEDRPNLRRLSGFRASVSHGAPADNEAPLFLTDLPHKLGLMGGTYVLDSIHTSC